MVSERSIPFNAGQDAWRRALLRARARAYVVEFLQTREINGVVMSFFRVNSNTHPGDWHYLSVLRLEHGFAVNCDCPAGEHNKVCVHAAVVLRKMSILDDPDPTGVVLPVAA
jgi:hypothetical protein